MTRIKEWLHQNPVTSTQCVTFLLQEETSFFYIIKASNEEADAV